MKKNIARAIVDVLMFVSMCFLAGTGLLIHYRLIPGSQGGEGLTLLGLGRHDWGAYHLLCAYFLLSLVVVHLVLNFAFIKNIIVSKMRWTAIVLCLAGICIAIFFLLAPIERTEDAGGKGHGKGYGKEISVK